MCHAVVAGVGGSLSHGCPWGRQARPGAGLQVQRPELVHAQHTPAWRRVVVDYKSDFRMSENLDGFRRLKQ